jgi:hypothetical protein
MTARSSRTRDLLTDPPEKKTALWARFQFAAESPTPAGLLGAGFCR